MVIGKISSLATTIFIFALGFVFLKQAWGSSIGASGQDVGAGLTGTASGITNLINAVVSPITGIISTFSSFFGSFSSNGSRSEPNPTGRDDRPTPTEKVKSTDTSPTSSITVGSSGSSGGYTSGAITAHRATGGFGRAN